jgi:toxin ParE1/3/4
VPRVLKRPAVELDLEGIAAYIGEDNADAANRFLAAAERALEQLARMPEMGQSRVFKNPKLRGLRSWRVSGFSNYLIFYFPIADGIEVLRLVHGAQNLQEILSND